jgi:dienelactone hydrolase
MTSTSPRIDISPVEGLIDEPLHVVLHGFQPQDPVTVHSSASFAEAAGTWSATATYVPDDSGTIDLDTQAPESGSYAVADSSALIWALRPDDPTTNSRALNAGLEPWNLTVIASQGDTTVSSTIQRKQVGDDVKLVEVREDDIIANLFLPEGKGPYPTVLVLGGSGGGFADRQAALLASHGFAAVSLAYFGVEGLPEELRRIPLEYFESALSWIGEHPLLDSTRLAVSGTSRGGELALLLASRYPQIRSVVAWVPSGYLWGAISRIDDVGSDEDFASWTYGGKALPDAGRVRNNAVAPDETGIIHLAPAYLDFAADESRANAALIPVENINGPVLLVSGKADTLWPSAHFGTLIEQRLRERGFDFAAEHLSYDDAGHSIGGGIFPTTINQSFHPIRKAIIDLGGTPEGLARARADSWPRALEFLRQHTSPAVFVGDTVSPSSVA